MAGGPGRNDEPSKASCSPPGAEPTQEPKIPGTTPWEPDTRPEHSLQLPLEKKRYSHNLYYVVNTNNYPSTQRARNYHFLGFYISQDNFLCVPHLTQTTPEKRLGLYPPLTDKSEAGGSSAEDWLSTYLPGKYVFSVHLEMVV